jgi:hypothetical protein
VPPSLGAAIGGTRLAAQPLPAAQRIPAQSPGGRVGPKAPGMQAEAVLREAEPYGVDEWIHRWLARTGTAMRDTIFGTPPQWSRLWRCFDARPAATARVLSKSIQHSASVQELTGQLSLGNTTLGWSTTVEELRALYGPRESWWGDLGAEDTRRLYHALLPTDLLEKGYDELPYSLEERAQMAIAARRAARLYTRERAFLPLAIGSELLDGVRQLLERGAFQPDGPSEAQIWMKYTGAAPSSPVELPADVYRTILEKACSSNRHVDLLCGQGADAAAAAMDAGVHNHM